MERESGKREKFTHPLAMMLLGEKLVMGWRYVLYCILTFPVLATRSLSLSLLSLALPFERLGRYVTVLPLALVSLQAVCTREEWSDAPYEFLVCICV